MFNGLKASHKGIAGVLAAALLLVAIHFFPVPGKQPLKQEAVLSAATAAEAKAKAVPQAVERKHDTKRTEKKQVVKGKSAEVKQAAKEETEPARPHTEATILMQAPQLAPPVQSVKEAGEEEGKDMARLRGSWFFDQRAYPNKHIPAGALQKAIEQRDRMRQDQRAAFKPAAGANAVISFPGDALWHLMGPQPINIPFTGLNAGFPTASGRVTAIAVDPTNANIVYIGGAAGGVWKTADGGTTWTALTDSQPSLAVGSIAIDPNSCAPGPCTTIYVGTGEENFNIDAFYGAGILKSINGGTSWTQLGASTFAQQLGPQTGGAYIGAIAVQPGNPSIVLAAVSFFVNGTIGGIYRSTDAGVTWTEDAAPQGLAATSVVFEPTSNAGATATAWMAMGDPFGQAVNGIYKSTDSGTTWTKQTSVLPTVNVGRIILGSAPSTSGATATLYAAIADSSTTSSNLLGLFKTTNGGTAWAAVSGPAVTGGFCAHQCFYDMAIGVSPANPSVVVLGGGAGPNNFTSLFESTNGGGAWTPASGAAGDFSNGSTSTHPHVDTHAIVFSPNGATLFVGNDGGIWSTTTPTPAAGVSPTWSDLNAGLAITQFYPGPTAAVSDENYGFGGTQDNDTELFQGSGSLAMAWQNEFACGDGGFTAIDQGIPTTIYTGCNSLAGTKIKKAVMNGQFVTSGVGTIPGFDVAETAITSSGDAMQFIPPIALDDKNPENLYFGTCRVWQTTNAASSLANTFLPLTPTWAPISGDLSNANAAITTSCPSAGGAGNITNLEVAHSSSSVIVAGTSNGKVWETTTGGLGGFWTEIDAGALPNRTVTAVRTKRSDSTGAEVYVTFSGFDCGGGCGAVGHVFKTTTAGTTNTWTNISGDLPDIPVNDIIVDVNGGGARVALYVATDVGVFACPDPEAATPCTNWTVIGDGLPNTPVLGLAMRRPSRVLRAATHGRSMWDIQLTDVNPPSLAALSSITPAAVNVGAASTAVTITGANFSGNTQVQFEGTTTGVTTTFVNTTQLNVTLSSTLLTVGGVYRITLTDPAGVDSGSSLLTGGGGPFAVMNPLVDPSSMTPATALTYTAVPFVFTSATATEPFLTNTVLAFYNVPPVTNPPTPPTLQFTLPTIFDPAPTITGGGTTYKLTTAITDFTTPFTYNVVSYNPTPGGGIDPAALNAPPPFSFGGPVPFSFTVTANPNPLAIVSPNPILLATALNTTSTVLNVSITNPGGAALMITAQGITGTNAANFSFAAPTSGATCNFPSTGQVGSGTITLAAGGGTCNFGMTYFANPTTPGNANSVATLTLTDNGSGNPQLIPITGVPLNSTVLVAVSPVNFGAVTIGTTSPTMNATLINLNPAALTVDSTGFTISGANKADFHFTAAATGPGTNPACPALVSFVLAANSVCDVGLNFTPSIVGAENATINVSDNGPGSPQNAPLLGIGVEITSISPSIVATGGPAFTLTVNGGGFAPSAVVNVSSINGTNVIPRLTTFVSANQLLASIPASDIATAGSLAITVTTPVPGGTTSEPKTLVVAQAPVATNDNINFALNVGTTPARITQDTTQATTDTGGVADPTPPCGSGSKAKSVWYTFTAPANGRVIADSRFSSYTTIGSAWTGTPPGALTAVAGACASGNVPAAGTSPVQSLLNFPVTSGTKYFVMVTDARTGTSAVGGTLTASLDFASAPPINDDFNSALIVAAPPSQNTVNSISATTDTGGRLDPTPSCATGAGLASGGKANTVWYDFTPPTNGTITADTLTSPYATILTAVTGVPGSFVEKACNVSAGPGIAQSQVTFPVTGGTVYSFMVSAFFGDGGTTNFHLTFSGAAIPSISFNPTNVPFGNQQVGTTSPVTNVTVTNNDINGAALHITGTSIAGGNSLDFTLVAATIGGTPCPNGVGALTLAQSASCVMGIQFKPTANGARNSNFNVTDDAAASPQSVPLSGTGTLPSISFNPTPLNFGNQQVGTTSPITNVTVTNNTVNGDPLHITGTSITGGTNTLDFTLVAATIGGTACPNGVGALTLAQGASCVIGIQFKPSTNGAENSNFSVTDDAAASPQSVPLNGTGTQPSISFNPTPVNFGSVTQSVTSATMNVTVTNNTANGDPLHITNTSIAGGTNTLDFTLVAATIGGTPCPIGAGALTLAQGASCVIGITFKPSTIGAENSNFNVADDAAASPQSVPLNGTGIAAVLSASLTPSPVPFGNQRVNTTGTAVAVTLTNTGTGTITLAAVNAVTIGGANAADFAIAAGTTCTNGANLAAPSGACVINLTFKPGASGARTATVNVSDNATASPQTATLNGTGIAPIATVTPSPLAFGNQRKGTTSAALTVTVKNTGTDTLNLAAANAIAISGANAADFANAAGTTCANSTALAPAASCIVNMTFTPSTAAAEAATLTITDDSNAVAGSAQPVSLTGTGIFPQAVATPNPLPFGNQPKSTTSAPLTVTLTNGGTDTLHLAAANAVAISGANAGDFATAAGTTCLNSATVAPGGAICIINVTFTPSTTAAEAATLTITDDVGAQVVSLTGTGTAANVTLSPSPVPFANQHINTTSASMTVTLNNTGAASVTLAAANAVTILGTDPGDFAIVAGTTTCTNGLVVAATNGSCVINVTFKPTAAGARTATLQVSDNAATSPQSVTLNGTGTAPTASVAPLNIPFPNQRKGTTSTGTDVTVSNTGTDTLNIASIALTGANPSQFVLGAPSSGTACSLAATPIAPAANCKFSVKFAPTVTGAQAASVTITDDSGGTAGTIQTVTLGGTGTLPQASAAPNPLAFGNQRKGTTSAALTVTLTNTGTDTLNLAAANAVAISGANATDFAVVAGTTTCKNSTAVPPAPGPGNTCVINVTFTPSTTAAEAATLAITDDSGGVAGTVQNVSLTGTGVLPQGGAAPPTLAFGNQPKGVTSGALTATLTNSGSDTLNLAGANAVAISGANAADFAIVAGTTTCKNSTAVPPAPGPGNSCVVNVTFTPSTTAAEAATLTITDDSGGVAGTTQTVSLTGTGVTATVTFSPSPEPFGNQRVGTTSAALTMTLTNSGNGGVTLATANAVTLSGGNAADFAITGGTCANSLALTAAPGPGNTCTVTATFTPSALGAENTTLTVTFQGATPAAVDNLTGTGVFPQATPSPNPVNFNNQVINTTSGPMTLTLANGGTDALHLSGANAAVIGGANAGDFAIASGTTCINSSAVAPGANCIINLTFTPTALNARTATLTITDDAKPTNQVVTLNGTGTNPAPTITSPLVPASAIAGGAAFVLTINGTNFVAGATVNFGANPALTPTTITAGQIVVTVPATDIATAGSVNVTVTNPAPGGGTSAPAVFKVNNPVPTLTLIAPTSATAGGTSFSLTLTGTNFVAGSTVNFGSNPALTTTSQTATQLQVTVPAADIALAATLNVTVTNPGPGGGTSGAQTFTINNPVPTLTSIAPTSAIAGGTSFTLTLTGTNFVAGSTVKFGTNPALSPTSQTATQIQVTVPAADIATAGSVNVTVTNPTPGGGTTGPQTFTINNPVPTITSLAPNSAVVGGAAFVLTVNGTNFVATSVVNFNGAARVTTFKSAIQITAAILATDLATAGVVNVTVTNPLPGGGTSTASPFTINNPQPVITSLSPSSAAAGGAAFTLTINGSSFVTGAKVDFGTDKGLTPASVTAVQIKVTIPATDIATGGSPNVVVNNPAPAVGPSAPSPFTVNNPVPTLTGATVSGNNHISGGAAFVLTVTGTNFVSGNAGESTVVNFNGKAEPTTFVSATQVTAAVPATDAATAGTFPVTVTNPPPNGGTTAAVNFTVDGFTVSGPATTTVKAGQQAMIQISVKPTANGFTNAVTSFSVSGLPAHTTFAFSPTSVTPNGATVTTTLTVTTIARGEVPPTAPLDPPVSPLLRLLPVLWLTALLAGLYAMQSIRRTPQLRRYAAIVPLALLLISGAVLAGCAGGKTGTAAGTSQLSITATSGSMSQTTPANSVALTVQ